MASKYVESTSFSTAQQSLYLRDVSSSPLYSKCVPKRMVIYPWSGKPACVWCLVFLDWRLERWSTKRRRARFVFYKEGWGFVSRVWRHRKYFVLLPWEKSLRLIFLIPSVGSRARQHVFFVFVLPQEAWTFNPLAFLTLTCPKHSWKDRHCCSYHHPW